MRERIEAPTRSNIVWTSRAHGLTASVISVSTEVVDEEIARRDIAHQMDHHVVQEARALTSTQDEETRWPGRAWPRDEVRSNRDAGTTGASRMTQSLESTREPAQHQVHSRLQPTHGASGFGVHLDERRRNALTVRGSQGEPGDTATRPNHDVRTNLSHEASRASHDSWPPHEQAQRPKTSLAFTLDRQCERPAPIGAEEPRLDLPSARHEDDAMPARNEPLRDGETRGDMTSRSATREDERTHRRSGITSTQPSPMRSGSVMRWLASTMG